MSSILIIAVVALAGGYAAYLQIKIKRHGVEADAVVINVKENWERIGDSDSLCYTYIVEYKNCDGTMITAALGGMSNTNKKLHAGDRIRIKYLKDKQDYPIWVKRLD